MRRNPVTALQCIADQAAIGSRTCDRAEKPVSIAIKVVPEHALRHPGLERDQTGFHIERQNAVHGRQVDHDATVDDRVGTSVPPIVPRADRIERHTVIP